jgi:tRNA A-37 threonylcarbamoyl transferase component Bud32
MAGHDTSYPARFQALPVRPPGRSAKGYNRYLLVIGRNIGNYKVVRVLGEGGMGTVYLAEHPMIGKRVAVKMLRPDLGTDPGLVSRFFQEAKAVNEIRHPNIVDISDFGHTDDGIVYFVMELLEGRSLRDRLSESGPLPVEQAVATARQVIDALAAAHRVGIIHRDLKPDNIFLVTDTQVPGGIRAKLFDFGVAKLVGEKQAQVGHKTVDGAVVGTPYYMSPEQALCHEVGAAADIYAMGVVLYEMLTGQVPFRSEQLVLLLNAILKQPAPPPSVVRPEIPPWLDRLVLRCLEKDPEARPRSMEEVSAVLGAGMAELGGGETALGATMLAPAGAALTPGVVSQSTSIRASAAARTSAAQRAVAAAARTTASTQAAAAGAASSAGLRQAVGTAAASSASLRQAVRGGVARPGEGPGLVARVRDYLDTRRVQRVAVPLIVVSALVIVASIFLSSATKRPVTEIVPEVAPPPPQAPAHAAIRINSEPSGAEVIRLSDNRRLGTTPLVDIRLADGHEVNYRFHLPGYTDVQIPFQPSAAGRFEITATLSPVERRSDSHARGSAGAGRRGRRDKKQLVQHVAAPAPTATPVAAEPQPALQPATLPPLGERNPVRRLGRR